MISSRKYIRDGAFGIALAILAVPASAFAAPAIRQLPDRPALLTADEKSGLLYIFGQDNGEVLVTDPQNGMRSVYRTKMFEVPEGVVYDAADGKIFELHYFTGLLVVFDANSIAAGKYPGQRFYTLPDSLKGEEKNLMALDETRRRLWITYSAGDKQRLYVFDTQNEALKKNILLEYPAASITVNPANGDLYLQHDGSKFITVIDGRTFEARKIQLSAVVTELYAAPSGGVYALSPYAKRVFRYDPASGSLASVRTGASAGFLVGLPGENRIFAISKFQKPNISVIDTRTSLVIKEVSLDAVPVFAFAAKEQGFIVIVTEDNKVIVLDASANVRKEVPVPPFWARGNFLHNIRPPLAYDGKRGIVYLANPLLNAVTEVDLKNFETTVFNWSAETSAQGTTADGRQVESPPPPDLMAPLSALTYGDKIFVSNYAGFITVFDDRLYRTLARVNLAPTIDSMILGGGKIYASSAYSAKVFRIDPVKLEVEKEWSVTGLDGSYWYLKSVENGAKILVTDFAMGGFAFLDASSGAVEWQGKAGAGEMWATYSDRLHRAYFMTRQNGIVEADFMKRTVVSIALGGTLPDVGSYFTAADLRRSDNIFAVYFDGDSQKVIGVNAADHKIVSDFTVASDQANAYDFVSSMIYDAASDRILIAKPGWFGVYSTSGELVKHAEFNARGEQMSGEGVQKGGLLRIFQFRVPDGYEYYLVMGTKIMRVDPASYEPGASLQTVQDESEGNQAIGLLGIARTVSPDPELRKLYIVYNYDGMAVYDFDTDRIWLRTNPGFEGVSWSAFHIVHPMAANDNPQPQVPPWITRERNIRIAFDVLGGAAIVAAAYVGIRILRRRKKSHA